MIKGEGLAPTFTPYCYSTLSCGIRKTANTIKYTKEEKVRKIGDMSDLMYNLWFYTSISQFFVYVCRDNLVISSVLLQKPI